MMTSNIERILGARASNVAKLRRIEMVLKTNHYLVIRLENCDLDQNTVVSGEKHCSMGKISGAWVHAHGPFQSI